MTIENRIDEIENRNREREGSTVQSQEVDRLGEIEAQLLKLPKLSAHLPVA